MDPASSAILETVDAVLRTNGFEVAVENLEAADVEWLIGENEFFVLAVIAGESLEALETAESVATGALLDRLGASEVGAKRWDAYVVLLTRQAWPTVDERERSELTYNTRGVRRLVGAEVGADETSVAVALGVFLPLGGHSASALQTVEADLVDALVVNGIDTASAQRYVAAYRATGTLDEL